MEGICIILSYSLIYIYIYIFIKITTFYGSESKTTRLLLSHFHMNINPKGGKFTIDVYLIEVDNSIYEYQSQSCIKFYFYINE